MESTILKRIYFPATLSYPALLRQLYSINSSLLAEGRLITVSIENIKKLYSNFGSPIDHIPIIHVGGTNGKGSTSLKIAQSLISCGFRTGLFVSPHLSSFRERIQINNILISEEEIVFLLPQILIACINLNATMTQFEISFLLACLQFQRAQCDVIVLEVGMGGELDATNVASTIMSIICSVSLDHVQVLGNTIEEIFSKKAGIFKPQGTALIGCGCPEELAQSIADNTGTELHTLSATLLKFYLNGKIGRDFIEPSFQILYGSDSSADDPSAGLPIRLELSPSFDPDDLNTCIAATAICLLGTLKTPLSSRLSSLSLLPPPTTTTTPSLLQGEVVEEEQRGVIASLRTALRKKPPCRWEVFRVPVTVPSQLGCFAATKVTVDPITGTTTSSDGSSSAIPADQLQGESVSQSDPMPDPDPVLVEVEVVLDVGHNPAALDSLAKKIHCYYEGRIVRILYGACRDKDVERCIGTLSTVTSSDNIYFTQSSSFRALSISYLRSVFLRKTGEEMGMLKATEVEDMVNELLLLSAKSSGVLIICGTGFIMPKIRAMFGVKEPRDDIDLVAE